MKRSTYYKTCPNCGANLDPGEHCDCEPTVIIKANKADMVDYERIAHG